MDFKSLSIGVFGMGYVGLPLAIEFSKKFKVIGFDTNKKRIADLNNNIDKTKEVTKKELINSKNILFSSNLESLKKCKIFIVCSSNSNRYK